jgi:hypothetical protein
MKPFAMNPHMTLVNLVAVLVCSELLAAGQSQLQSARELIAQ